MKNKWDDPDEEEVEDSDEGWEDEDLDDDERDDDEADYYGY